MVSIINVSTTVNYAATVNGTQQQGQATGGSATSETVAEITGVAVGSPATETNMIQNYPNQGDINYGTVEAASTNATAAATTSPATVPVEKEIKWANGTAVQGNNAQRNYSLATSQEYTIDPTLAGHDWKGHNVYLWVIWAKVTIGTAGNISTDDMAAVLNNGNWPASLGGGTALGPLSTLQNKNMTYAYSIGKYEAKATLQPVGVWNAVAGSAWYLDRKVNQNIYDNGGHYVGGVWQAGPLANSGQDNSASFAEYVKPSDKNSGTIYDLDAPGCSADFRLNVIHTAEDYDNFTEYAVVTLDKLYTCSDPVNLYYEARVDADNKVVRLDAVGNGSITFPNAAFFAKR